VELVYEANLALAANGLIKWTSGNASGRDPDTGLIVIKPSGVRYSALRSKDMVILDLDGHIVSSNEMRPSTDAASHLYIYNNALDVGAVIHTHSTYATAWAAVGRAIPPVLSSIADVFGGPIPCGRYQPTVGSRIGEEVLRVRGRSPAVLMKNHGVFCAAKDVSTTLRAAVMVEEVAQIVWISAQLGHAEVLSTEEIDRYFAYYQGAYGQGSNSGNAREAAP
jgi:L-ribulose-5-phosphate 4-epimerase